MCRPSALFPICNRSPFGHTLAELIHTSKIYDGMKSEYWIYVPAQYIRKAPAALMVFQDGGW